MGGVARPRARILNGPPILPEMVASPLLKPVDARGDRRLRGAGFCISDQQAGSHHEIMRRIYARIPQIHDVKGAVDQLLEEGVEAKRIRLFSRRPGDLAELPVRASSLRPPLSSIARGAAAGAVIGLVIVIVLGPVAGAIGWVPALALVILCALLGAAAGRVMRAGGLDREAREVARRQGGLGRGETVLLMDVQDAEAAQIERNLSRKHPEIAVLGTDPGGTPPFP